MVDKQEELIKFVKNKILDLILKESFPDTVYKQERRDYFFVHLRNQVGMPSHSEIANNAMEYLFKSNYFKNKDHLKTILQRPFFKRNISKPEYYLQKFERTVQKPELDIKLLRSKEYETSKIEEFTKHVIDERTSDIAKGIKEMEEAYDSITSKLESEVNIPEPEMIEAKSFIQYDPWWKTLGLKEDPFPNTNGLGNIDTLLYERIIIKTEIYEKYVYFINNIPKDLFKNTIFYGQYGCGKTTLFEYLKNPLIKAHIDPIIITLSAEPDYQNFLMNFKKALCTELIKIYEKLTTNSISDRLDAMNLDDQIIQCFELIRGTGMNKGFVIFIDDIYKPPAYEKTAFMFLNQLQTFKTQLTQRLNLFDIGFFISAPNEWRPIINGSQEYSGSISMEEIMPFPTVEQGRSMFNERLAAFAIDEKYRRVTSQFALQVYQTLISKKAWTFRQFIHECLSRFKSGNFDILTSNPVSINNNTLKGIKQILENNTRLNDGIKEIFTINISTRKKTQCLELLVQIFNEKGFDEDSELYQEKRYYLDILRRTGLIVKRRGNNFANWVASKEVFDFDKEVFDKFSLYLDDYFLKLFEGKLDTEESLPPSSDQRYLTLIEDLIECIKKKNNKNLNSIQSGLEITLQLHKEIIDNSGISNSISYEKFAEKCLDSMRTLSESVFNQSGLPTQGGSSGDIIEFWNDFWYHPDSLDIFLKYVRNESESVEHDKIYLFNAYDNAFKDIVSHVSNQINKNEIYEIPVLGLKNSEIQLFNEARDLNSQGNRDEGVELVSKMVENKLREFLYSVFILQYGERNRRIQRIPLNLHKVIEGHEKSDRTHGFGISKNELTNLTRENYCGIIVGFHRYNDIGWDNWYRTFSKIFLHWDPTIVKSYFTKFVQYNIRSIHSKNVFTPTIQADINQFIIYSIELLVRINECYYNFLQKVIKVPRSGTSEMEYYFTLDENILNLQPVRVSETNRQRLIDNFKRTKTNTIDLSSPCDTENKYRMNYQEVFAVVTDLLLYKLPGFEVKMKRRDPIITLRLK